MPACPISFLRPDLKLTLSVRQRLSDLGEFAAEDGPALLDTQFHRPPSVDRLPLPGLIALAAIEAVDPANAVPVGVLQRRHQPAAALPARDAEVLPDPIPAQAALLIGSAAATSLLVYPRAGGAADVADGLSFKGSSPRSRGQRPDPDGL